MYRSTLRSPSSHRWHRVSRRGSDIHESLTPAVPPNLSFPCSPPIVCPRLWRVSAAPRSSRFSMGQDYITSLGFLCVSHTKTLLCHGVSGAPVLPAWGCCHHRGRCRKHQHQASPRAGKCSSESSHFWASFYQMPSRLCHLRLLGHDQAQGSLGLLVIRVITSTQ